MSRRNTSFSSLKPLTRSLAIAVATSLPAFALAQETTKKLAPAKVNANTEESYKVENSNNIKYTQPLLDTAKTITVIPQSVMKDRGVESLRDALRNVSGISFAAGEGGAPTGDSMTIRGFSATTDMFVDGIRDIAGYTRDMFNVESVEVAKGPGSAASGRGATGGSINMQNKAAKLDDASNAYVRLGSEGDYRTTIDTNKKVSDTAAVRVNALLDDGDTAGRDEVNNSNYGLALSLATGLGTQSRFTLNGDVSRQDNMPDYGLPWVANYSDNPTRFIAPELAQYEGGAPNVPFSNFYGNLNRDYEEIDARSLTAKYEYDVGQNTMLRTQARVGSVARESIVTAPRFTSVKIGDNTFYGTGARVGLADEKTRDTKNSLKAIQFDLLGEYMTGSIKHNVVAGIELAQDRFERWTLNANGSDNLDNATLVSNDLYNPNPNLAFNGRYARNGEHSDATGDTLAVYAFDTLTLSEQWEVTAGLRQDEFEVTAIGADGTQLKSDSSMLSWNAAVVFKPVANGSIYLGAGNSFNPSGEGLSVSANTSLRELDPEETQSLELGTKWNLLDNRLALNAAVFQTTKTNARMTDPADTTLYVLVGEQEVKGVELSASGQVTEKLLVQASYTQQKAEITKSLRPAEVGADFARTPEGSLALWSRYDISDAWAVGFGLNYMGETYNGTDPGSREKADAYTLVEMMASYTVNQNLSLQFNGTNLTDKEYIDQLGGGHFIPGEGRYLRLGATYNF